MDPALQKVLEALSQKEFDLVMMKAASHADVRIRKYVWRACRPKTKPSEELMVEHKTADDFVYEAVQKLCDGRKYNPSRTLLDNLNSVSDSLIWSAKKTSDRSAVIDYVEKASDDGMPASPKEHFESGAPAADDQLVEQEIRKNQQKLFDLIRASFDGDDEIQSYLDALRNQLFSPADISDATGIPVGRIYEIRRALTKYAARFFGVHSYEELEQRLMEGK